MSEVGLKYKIFSADLKRLMCAYSPGSRKAGTDMDARQYVLLKFSDGKVSLDCCNKEVLVEASLNVESLKMGSDEVSSFLVRGDVFTKMLSSFNKNTELLFYKEEKQSDEFLVVKNGKNSVIKIKMVPLSFYNRDVPAFDEIYSYVEIRAGLLKECFQSLGSLSSRGFDQEKMYSRFGIFISGDNNVIKFIGLDGARLVQVEAAAITKFVGNEVDINKVKNGKIVCDFLKNGFVMETNCVTQLMSVLNNVNDDVVFSLSWGQSGFKDYVIWTVNADEVSMRFIGLFLDRSDFPDCGHIFSMEYNNEYLFNKSKVLDSIMRPQCLSDKICLFFPNKDDNKTYITVGGVQKVEQFSQEDVDFSDNRMQDGNGFIIGFNASFLSSALRNIRGEKVRIRTSGKHSQLNISSVLEDKNFLLNKNFIIMPMNMEQW